MTSIFAFAGRRGSGKSTASETLYERGYVDVKFADPLKNMLRAFYRTVEVDADTIERKLEGDLKEVPCDWLGGKTPRFAMQKLGTEWRNMISETLWSDILYKRVMEGMCGDKIVVSDLRFKHELPPLEELGAVVAMIKRDAAPQDAYSEHVSESGIDSLPIDLVVTNNGTIEELRARITRLADQSEVLAVIDEDLVDTIVEVADAV